jgi:hypothetical protein
MVVKKPMKMNTQELYLFIERAIERRDYYFTDHGQIRSITRQGVTDEEVLTILEGKEKWHEKYKDKYQQGQQDWNYHLRGYNTDGERIRIVISFDEYEMLVITVINLDEDSR